MKTFQSVHSFQVFVPEKSGWLKYTQSWSTPDLWLCNFSSQDGKVLAKTALLDPVRAQEIWDSFQGTPPCSADLRFAMPSQSPHSAAQPSLALHD